MHALAVQPTILLLLVPIHCAIITIFRLKTSNIIGKNAINLGYFFQHNIPYKMHKTIHERNWKRLTKGSGYFASRDKIAPCYFAIWRQNSPNGYFALSAKITLNLTQTQTLTLILTQTLILIPTLTLTLTLREGKHYFASGGKIATSLKMVNIHAVIHQSKKCSPTFSSQGYTTTHCSFLNTLLLYHKLSVSQTWSLTNYAEKLIWKTQ